MVITLGRRVLPVALLFVFVASLALSPLLNPQQSSGGAAVGQDQSGSIAASRAELVAMTPKWTGERFVPGYDRAFLFTTDFSGTAPQPVDAPDLRIVAPRFNQPGKPCAVRLEVAQASGMSQVSPDQFPESDATRSAMRVNGSQRFAYRFSGGDFALRVQADQILPELTVSQLLSYHHGENELALDAEIELDVREAPLRELLLRVPKNYAVAKLNASGLSDYFLSEPADQSSAELRLVYGQPVSGRQVDDIDYYVILGKWKLGVVLVNVPVEPMYCPRLLMMPTSTRAICWSSVARPLTTMTPWSNDAPVTGAPRPGSNVGGRSPG
jgi:hypothetical protein